MLSNTLFYIAKSDQSMPSRFSLSRTQALPFSLSHILPVDLDSGKETVVGRLLFQIPYLVYIGFKWNLFILKFILQLVFLAKYMKSVPQLKAVDLVLVDTLQFLYCANTTIVEGMPTGILHLQLSHRDTPLKRRAPVVGLLVCNDHFNDRVNVHDYSEAPQESVLRCWHSG